MKFSEHIEDLPIISKISFHKVYELLLKASKGDSEIEAKYASALLEKFEQHEELKNGTVDLGVLERKAEFIKEIMSILFPSVLTLNEIKGAAPPFQFDFFYTSERFRNIIKDAGEDFSMEIKQMDPRTYFIMACCTILGSYYHYPIDLKMPIIFEIPDKNKQPKFYRSAFNADMIEAKPTENAIEITEDIYNDLLDNFENLSVWKKYFPKDSWEVRGIGLVNFLDVTTDQLISQITSSLLNANHDNFDQVASKIKTILNVEELDISFISLENNTKLIQVEKKDAKNILLEDLDSIDARKALCQIGYKQLFIENKPFVISNTDTYIKQNDNILSDQLRSSYIKSYLLAPLKHNDEFLGLIELGSKKARAVNSMTYEKLKLLTPILAMAISRYKEEHRILTEAIIQEQCTSIHSSVKWKFEKMAHEIIEAREYGKSKDFEDLVFENVFPLYGQVDIIGSSTKRNQSVLKDLSAQLTEVKVILDKAMDYEKLSAFEELLFRLNQFLKEFEIGLFEGSEQRVLQFLNQEIYPIFDYLSANNIELSQSISEYKSKIDVKSGIIYNERKKFDNSVGVLNHRMARYIDEKQAEAQKLFPHFFERYKTDGLEFNMYIGESISEEKRYNSIYLNNLHLWQLQTICEIENLVSESNKSLSLPLDVASLILLINNSLDIKFRIDEKRFDVDGAYNARYEIIKKRIDKAHIKNTNERITQKGKIAIVYSDQKDIQDYRKHIDFLINKGYIKEGSIEDYELEDLQGISGLRAIRVELNRKGIEIEDEFLKIQKTEMQ